MLESKITNDPFVKTKELKRLLKEDHSIDVNNSMIRRAKRQIVQKNIANYEDEYAHVRAYGNIIMQTNKGSTVVIKVHREIPSSPPIFDRLYVCLDN